MNDALNEVSMKIILHAGDARKKVMDAFLEVSKYKFDEANTLLDEAKQDILKAHKSQTAMIQQEAEGIKQEYSLLFSHSQDHLMTVNSEWNIAKHITKIVKNLHDKLEEK